MRYPKDHKEQTRQRLLQASAGHAKAHGFAASGMDTLAAAAGVTVGSLYKHFSGKDALFAELVRSELQRSAALFDGLPQGDARALLELLRGYASRRHVQSPEAGCLLPGLSAEVARAPDEVRAAFQAGLQQLHAAVASRVGAGEDAGDHRGDRDPSASSGLAWALIAQSVGAVLLARALPEAAVQQALLRGVRDATAELIGAQAPPTDPGRDA